MRRSCGKRKLLMNKKGVTLVEAVVSIALISIVSIGVTTLFFSLSKISKMSNKQLEINGIMRVVHDNVIKSARSGTDIEGNPGKRVNKTDITGLQIKDLSGTDYPEYRFDLDYLSSADYGDSAYQVDTYRITIKTADGVYVTEFCIEIYP